MKNEKLKRGQEIRLEISDLAFGGRGIAKLNDLVFFVSISYFLYSFIKNNKKEIILLTETEF